jgi:transcriptional regulator with PAS, ATPase and Fis domain
MGFFEVCNNGTLFLDEIADMPLNLQSKILRAAEEKTITRVGDTKPISTDFRIISSTNLDIEKRVTEKKFRLDLLHRLNTVNIHIPPLRERPQDIEPLLIHFINMFSQKLNRPEFTIQKEVFSELKHYSFPGNIRELKNMAERAIILSKGNVLEVHDFPTKAQSSGQLSDELMSLDLEKNEISLVRKALLVSNYNQTKAADLLGITRHALIRRMKKHQFKIGKNEM